MASGKLKINVRSANPNDEIIPVREKEKDVSSSQESSSKESTYDDSHEDNLCLQLQDSDGNIQTKNACSDPQILYNSSIFQVNEDDGTCYAECHDIIFPEDELNSSIEDEALGGWFKITIPNGRKYSKMWIINLLQSHCSVAFTPVDFQYIRNQIQFFVQNSRSAYELKNINYQLRDEENRKISIYVSSSIEPVSVQYKLTPEQMEILKLSMKKRYNVSHKSLYLKKFRFDSDLTGHGIDIFLNRRSCMAATLQVIQVDYPELLSLNLSNNKIYWLDGLSELIERAPQIKILDLSRNLLKTVWELEKMKGLKLKELWLEGNPLCSTFPDHSAYVSAVLNCFPELLHLDGWTLFPTVDADTLEIIKPRKESYRGSESLKNLVVQFMLQYYLIYDYGDRRNLLTAYHADACFSLTITFNSNKPDITSLEEYCKDSRNMKKLKDSTLRRRLLKHKKCSIVTCLQELPKTQHDLNSCVVDICAHTEKMICFSVNGVFKEMEGKSEGCIRAFTRTFILTTGRYFRLCIVNDEMILRNASPSETKKAFSTTMPTIFCAQSSQQMKDSSTQTDLKYLEDEWDSIGDDEALGTVQLLCKVFAHQSAPAGDHGRQVVEVLLMERLRVLCAQVLEGGPSDPYSQQRCYAQIMTPKRP
ncbi:nuclear RNA export factor 5-like [Onychomys torridus]|uniref:nuclear RNA export factor 5-like n=1 Tax=Onychomys torridus TaxID=38674 RepID=UPI00167F5F27|nr:nuclear RNA export factor 5-like [Onychomys torridus]